jgi:hypothetical protein
LKRTFFRTGYSRVACLVVVITGACFCCNAHAGQRRVSSASDLASYKSRQMASIGIDRLRTRFKSPNSTAPFGMRHVLRHLMPVNASYEGIGFSATSAKQAIRSACFYGRRPMVAYSVARGRDGYFATVYYR